MVPDAALLNLQETQKHPPHCPQEKDDEAGGSRRIVELGTDELTEETPGVTTDSRLWRFPPLQRAVWRRPDGVG